MTAADNEQPIEFPSDRVPQVTRQFTATADAARIAEILDTPSGFIRLNVGRRGRSAELFSDETCRLLEGMAEAGEMDGAAAACATLEGQVERLGTALRRWLAGQPG